MTKIHDVIIIGAGASGLSAAKLCHESGLDVLVLEARNRVGGRTLTVKNDKVGWVDLGGAYVGRTQNHLLSVIKEFNLRLYPVNEVEKLVFYDGFNAERYLFDKEELPGNEEFQADLLEMTTLIDTIGEGIPADAPWNAVNAEELDKQTFAQFIDKHMKTRQGKEFMRIFISTIVTTEPHEASALWFLWYVKQCGGTRPVFSTTGGGQEFKVHGGTNQITELLASKIGKERVKLENAVYYLEQDDDVCLVKTLSGGTFRSKFIIMATPPAVQQKIHYNPPLPAMKNQLIQRLPQGSVMKCIVYYKNIFWRPKNMCGSLLFVGPDDEFPITYAVDDSKPDGSHPAIIGFIPADKARKLIRLTKEERLKLIAAAFTKAFSVSEEEATPIHYEEHNWMAEQYSGGCYTMTMAPGVMTKYVEHLKKPFGRIYYAGTETASEWSGYINGAIQAGKRAAREILAKMGRIPETEIDIAEPVSQEYPPIF